MTPSTVTRRVEEMRSVSEDDEHAHGLEDALWEAVLESIADGSCSDPKKCARIALTTRQIPFSRWTA